MDDLKARTKKEFIEKITEKKEFSMLPIKDVEIAYAKFDVLESSDYEKLKLTRDFLRKVYSSFSSRKLLNIKDKDEEWVLKKHKSTKERFEYYNEIYRRILKDVKGKISIIDLGAGVNGFSYRYFKNNKINYVATEAVGQFVNLMNFYFDKEKIKAKAYHISLFDIGKTKDLIKDADGEKIIFMFKIIDSLEIMERDYSKKLLDEIIGLVDKIVLSFPTKSLGKRQRFAAQRKWIMNFIKDNFNVLDDFEYNGERYICFKKKE